MHAIIFYILFLALVIMLFKAGYDLVIGFINWVSRPLFGHKEELDKIFNAKDEKTDVVEDFIKVRFANGEPEILKAIFDIFFTPTWRIGNVEKIAGLSADILYEQLKSSNRYIYIVNFVKKYGDEYSKEDLVKLKELLSSQGFHFNEEQLLDIISSEKLEQEYLNFKKMVLSYSPITFKDYVTSFVQIFNTELSNLVSYGEKIKKYGILVNEIFDTVIQPELPTTIKLGDVKSHVIKITHKIHFLKRILSENKIALKKEDGEEIDNKELIENITTAKKEIELEKFKKGLADDKVFSIGKIDSMDGYEFENFLKVLFGKMGYVVEQTKLSGDQGADLIISKAGETTVVQAKRSTNKIANKAIQEIVASINYYKAQKGMVVTNNEFTPAAIELSRSNKIELVDREELERLIKEHL